MEVSWSTGEVSPFVWPSRKGLAAARDNRCPMDASLAHQCSRFGHGALACSADRSPNLAAAQPPRRRSKGKSKGKGGAPGSTQQRSGEGLR
eukprot:6467134-Amphidinium_carterae.3